MQVTNNPADIVTEKEMEYLKEANERLARHFIAIIAERNGIHGVSLVCSILGVSRNTVYRGLRELQSKEHLDEGRVRKQGGGRKSTLAKHPEYITVFREIVEFDIAGLPQNANTKWLRLSPSQIQQIFYEQYHIAVSLYTVRQIIKAEGYTRRKPVKALPMADCELRDEQFKVIEQLRRYSEEHGIPIFSVDTKKKELLGPYRRDNGTAYTTEPVEVNDHDYSTFSNGKMVPYGIYDVTRNTGYMTFGVSHDTAEFACECFAQQWERHLRHIYPSAKTILILCDGGGSNNARSWQFKWCLIQLAKRLGINIRIAHYPPYCSKWNPIEHRLFSQISRVWSGAVFNTIEEASELASRARTKTGLAVFTSINRRIYETKTERNPLFESECDKYIVKDEILPKWNYLVRCN
jgi:transposase